MVIIATVREYLGPATVLVEEISIIGGFGILSFETGEERERGERGRGRERERGGEGEEERERGGERERKREREGERGRGREREREKEREEERDKEWEQHERGIAKAQDTKLTRLFSCETMKEKTISICNISHHEATKMSTQSICICTSYCVCVCV